MRWLLCGMGSHFAMLRLLCMPMCATLTCLQWSRKTGANVFSVPANKSELVLEPIYRHAYWPRPKVDRNTPAFYRKLYALQVRAADSWRCVALVMHVYCCPASCAWRCVHVRAPVQPRLACVQAYLLHVATTANQIPEKLQEPSM